MRGHIVNTNTPPPHFGHGCSVQNGRGGGCILRDTTVNGDLSLMLAHSFLIRYTSDMHGTLVNRAKLVTSTKQRLAKKGGKQMILFLDKVWTFTVPVSDIITIH